MKFKPSLRHLFYGILAILFVRFVYLNRGQLVDIVAVLRSGIWYYLLVAVALFGLIVLNQGLLYSSIYAILRLPPERKKLSAIFLVSRFMSVAAPSGGLSGAVPFIQDARRRQLPVGTVLIANLIYLIVWYSTFALILLIGLLHLFLVHDLQWFEVAEAIILISFTGLLVDYCERVGARVSIRGLRAVSDFEYEFQMAMMNRHLKHHIETMFMAASEAHFYTSSRLVKEVARLGGDVSGLLPAAVSKRLRERLDERR